MLLSHKPNKILNINRFTLLHCLQAVLLLDSVFGQVMEFLFKDDIVAVENGSGLIDI
jgi:hypothetical protein